MLTFRDGNPWPLRYALPAILALGVGLWALYAGIVCLFGLGVWSLIKLGLFVWEMV
jgi:hypothetical protein